MKKTRYFFEYLAALVLISFFRILPLNAASAFGGWLTKTIGPHLASSRKAIANIERAFPDLDKTTQNKILRGMWENIGRVIAEYPHIPQIARDRIEINDNGWLQKLANDDKGAIIISAHFGNWELFGKSFLENGLEGDILYRQLNNPWTERMLLKLRNPTGDILLYTKSKTGMRQLIKALQQKRHVGIMIDQKYNEGIALPFFGHPAMTSTSFVQLATKYNCPIVPVYVERLEGAYFKLHVLEPMEIKDSNGEARPTEEIMLEANSYLEDWITKNPEQWLWLHRRWTDRAEKEYQKQKSNKAA